MKKEVRQSQVLWAVFDRKMRKFRLIATGVIVFLLVCAGRVYFAHTQLLQKKPQTAKPTIALVLREVFPITLVMEKELQVLYREL